MKNQIKLLLSTLLLALACPCYGQLAVYKTKIAGTVTGGGNVARGTLAGPMILDITNGTLVWFRVKGSQFHLTTNNWTITTVLGTGGKTYTVLSLATNVFDANGKLHTDSIFFKGVNVATDIGLFSGQKFLIPKTLKLVGRSVYPDPQSGLPFAEETTGTMALDINETEFHNTAGSLEDAIKFIRDILLAQGFTEL